MQINIYCLMTNQMPALLVQHILWMRAANRKLLLLQSLYFSRPPPPTAIIPNACPLGTFEIEMATINSKMHYISMIARIYRGLWTV